MINGKTRTNSFQELNVGIPKPHSVNLHGYNRA